ncbi:Hypothetical predicted protein [Mytilus galloprovincialis]|uniref:Uncharacterized protein n=1 Tax=Mytilus galloprovincialis TaxID=29158 RepID=A0A8B6DLU2_MYTGA|nr:Hypothetical predicted protein [Mytilus galloprovincialis]
MARTGQKLPIKTSNETDELLGCKLLYLGCFCQCKSGTRVVGTCAHIAATDPSLVDIDDDFEEVQDSHGNLMNICPKCGEKHSYGGTPEKTHTLLATGVLDRLVKLADPFSGKHKNQIQKKKKRIEDIRLKTRGEALCKPFLARMSDSQNPIIVKDSEEYFPPASPHDSSDNDTDYRLDAVTAGKLRRLQLKG